MFTHSSLNNLKICPILKCNCQFIQRHSNSQIYLLIKLKIFLSLPLDANFSISTELTVQKKT